MELIRRLAEDDKDGVMAHKVNVFLLIIINLFFISWAGDILGALIETIIIINFFKMIFTVSFSIYAHMRLLVFN